LNLAQAVQICAYELRLAAQTPVSASDDEPLATAQELADTVAHIGRVMQRVGFFNPLRPKLLPARLRRFVNRGGLKRSEMRLMRGFCTAIEETLDTPRGNS
jgi:tRNA C32,U32 (ribose-2'-O)-methylase TrmJ